MVKKAEHDRFEHRDVIRKDGLDAWFEHAVGGTHLAVKFHAEPNKTVVLRDEGWTIVETAEQRRRRLGLK